MKQKYSIGLDLGTNSIGWAVVDGDFSLIKKGGKDLWGVLIFSEGDSAQERRAKRAARRRLERRKERIKLLQHLLAKEINAVDEGFFFRLENSFLASSKVDESSIRNFGYNLFNGDYNDKEYYKRYPTIYHLRAALCNSEVKADIRLIYLALHHIVKYRGNFLHDEENITPSKDGIIEKLKQILNENEELIEKYSNFNSFDAEKITQIITEKGVTSSDKAKKVKETCGNDGLSEFVGKALCGLTASPKKAFKTDEETFDQVKDVQFSKESFEAIMEENQAELGEQISTFINDLYSVYLEKIFVDILGEGNISVSDAMVKKYNKHKEDLFDLKSLLKNDRSLYRKMFVSKRRSRSSVASYSNYVKRNTKTTYFGKNINREDFYKFVKQTLESVADSQLKQKILNEIELKTFMPKINDIENSAIPYQINKSEMEQIIDGQAKFYPVLAQNKDKIMSLLTFRRPYYVGPLKGKFSWIEQEIKERIYPWNFNELVDLDAANQKFIESLVEKDDITNTERLALESITYQKYIVLNELNNIRYKNRPLPVELKQAVYNELVLEKNKVSIKDIVYLLNRKGLACTLEDLSGFADDKKLLGSMKTYREFKRVLGNHFTEADVYLYDKAVGYLTAFNDVKSRVNMLGKLFKGKYDKQIIKNLAQKNYAGWGKFSYERLTDKYDDSESAKSILDLLYETEENYMSIVYNEKYGLMKKFIKENKTVNRISYGELISDIYASPEVKKVSWQAVKIVEEIKQIMRAEPEYIFVESARKPEEKKKQKDRYETIKELYKSIKTDTEYYNSSIQKELDGVENEKVDAEKLYLYLMQLGRCAYTETKLNIDRLSDYEVDHIIPRCFIKDDSLDNKVLVCKEENQRKSSLALSDSIIEKRQKYWKFLLDNKFISKKKYENLNRREWEDSDAKRFINRQLVELNQINKTVIETLKCVLSDSEVLPIKSAIISQMRKMHTDINPQKYGNFFKLRSLNDLHHAKDAYLVGVLGLFTKENFPVWGNEERSYAIKKVIDSGKLSAKKTNELINKRYGIIIDQLKYGDYSCINRNGEVIDASTAYNNVLKVMDKNDVKVVVKKEFDGKTEFYNQTLYGPKKVSGKSNLIPLRYVLDKDGKKVPLNTEIYGGYSNENQAYFVNVEYNSGKKRVEKLVGVSALTAKRYANGDKNAIINALIEKGYEKPTIIGKPVYSNQLIRLDGQNVLITSATEVCNATQLLVDSKFHQVLYLIEKNIDSAVKLEDFDKLAKEFLLHYLSKLQEYYPLFNSIRQKIQSFINAGFDELSSMDKAKYIQLLLVVTSRGAGRVDMPEKWNGGSSWGRIKGKTIERNKVEWIDQSITGYYVNKITPANE